VAIAKGENSKTQVYLALYSESMNDFRDSIRSYATIVSIFALAASTVFIYALQITSEVASQMYSFALFLALSPVTFFPYVAKMLAMALENAHRYEEELVDKKFQGYTNNRLKVWFLRWSNRWKPNTCIILSLALLVLFGVIAFGMHYCGVWKFIGIAKV
jgi:hypothetical protein